MAKIENPLEKTPDLIPQPVPVVPCPDPSIITLDASKPNVNPADFNAAQLANYQGALLYNVNNKGYAHTFEWKLKHRCCQVLKAVLTVKLKALSGGSGPTSADAANDTISIRVNGGAQLGSFGQKVYPPTYPFPVGKLSTVAWTLTGTDLNSLNLNNRLSFYVQDDSSVISATLVLTVCCLKEIPKPN